MTDLASDNWLYHRIFDCHTGDLLVGGGSNVGFTGASFEIDSKAMRKVGNDDSIVAVLEVVEDGDATINIRFETRMLFKLP